MKFCITINLAALISIYVTFNVTTLGVFSWQDPLVPFGAYTLLLGFAWKSSIYFYQHAQWQNANKLGLSLEKYLLKCIWH